MQIPKNKRSIEIVQSIINERGYKLIETYTKNWKTKVIIEDKFGYKYDVLLDHVKDETRKFSLVDKSNPYTLENISLWLKLNNKNFELCKNNVFNGSQKLLSFHCLKCNEDFKMGWNSVSCGRNCAVCAGYQVSKTTCFSYLYPKLTMEWSNKNIIKPNQITKGCEKDFWWECKDCGNEWLAKTYERIKGYGCPKCKKSKGEKRIIEFLEKNSILYVPQYRIKECRYIRPLPFDFYLSAYKILIEFDGEMHTEIHRYINKERAQIKLQECQRNDNIKTQFCIDNDIPLLRISYTDFDNIEQILSDYLNLNNN